MLDEGTECVPACTARYAAPEVAQARLSGKPLHVTSAVDVWALALVLFELFAGAPLLDDLGAAGLALANGSYALAGENLARGLVAALSWNASNGCAISTSEATAARATSTSSRAPRFENKARLRTAAACVETNQ